MAWLELITALSAALFAGAALYVSVVEHPARMTLQTRMAALQWAPSYKRGTWLQAPLAAIGLVSGGILAALGAGTAWLVGALLIGSAIPFTLVAIMPINHRLLDPTRDLDSLDTRALLAQWGRLHAVRTVLGLLALLIDLWALRTA